MTADGFRRYLLAGVVTWVVVDFTTAFNPDVQRWLDHMPLIWVFYVGYPLVFAHLIYNRRWSDRSIFLAMIAGGFFVEIVCSNNSLLYTYPIMLAMIPVALAIYGVVTFIPKWLVEGELKARWRTTAFLLAVYFIVAVLNYFNKASAL
ncbi:hypothetical protein KAV47_01245 [Candidatus Bathyarchaeota archaeon]|nr:hypothetical protein [Candidatus Bathyarchaeota archaeon]